MKKLVSVFLLLLSLASCSEKEVEIKSLVERNGIMHEVNNDKPFSGKVFDKYENQQFKMKGHYKKGLKTGVWEYFKNNGQIIERKNYSNGKLDGKYEKFNDNNVVIEVKNYKNGKLNGLYEAFTNDGKKIKSVKYKNGLLNGNYKKFNKKGIVLENGDYLNDKKNGLWVYQYDDYKIEENYKNGKLDGDYKKIKSNTIISQGRYKNGIKIEKWTERFNNGKIKTENVYNGTGKLIKYKEWNKQNQLIRESEYPGITKWYKNKKKIAEAKYTSNNTLIESSLKIWFNNKGIYPYKIFSQPADWEENGYNYMEDKHAPPHFILMFRENKSFGVLVTNKIGWVAKVTDTKGKWSIVDSYLPKLAIQVNTEFGSKNIYKINNLSSKKMNFDNTLFIKTRTF